MTMGMRVAGLTWCTLAALAVPALAHAQSVTQAPAAETVGERAAPFFQEGLKAADEMRWTDAEAAYLKAWAIAKTFDIAANLGVVELKLGKPRLAAVHLAFSLRTAPPSAKAPNLERTRYFLNEAKKLIGVVRVRVTPPDAEVLVDGKALPAEETADAIFMDPGTHRVTARRDGYVDGEKVVTVMAGTSQDVTLSLMERPAGPPATPPATAFRAPSREAPAAPADPPPDVKRSWVPVIALGAASVVGLGVGIGTTLASNAASADVDRQAREILGAGGQCAKATDAFVAACAEIHRTGQRADVFGNAARVAYIAAGALAAATMTYVLWPSGKPSGSAPVSARLEWRSDGVGIGAVGVW